MATSFEDNGENVTAVRDAGEADAEALLSLQRGLDIETPMMMLEEGERTTTIEELRRDVNTVVATRNSTILVAESDHELVGYVEAEGGPYRRTRHSAHVVSGVRQAYQDGGVGRALLGALEVWARAHRVRRLELTVRVDNQCARRLYEHAGYATEGLRRGSLLVGDELLDETAMARLLLPLARTDDNQ